MRASAIKALLFDMGGVVLDVQFRKVLNYWAQTSNLSLQEIQQRFSMDEAYCLHETGAITSSDYFNHLRQHLELTGTDSDIEAGWNALFGNEFSDALDAIDTVRTRYPCYAFTNTNEAHQQYWEKTFPRIRKSFDKVFVSSEIGLRKPEVEAFEHILQFASVEADQMLFFDDSPENIEGAERVGLQCVLVNSRQAVAEALKRLP